MDAWNVALLLKLTFCEITLEYVYMSIMQLCVCLRMEGDLDYDVVYSSRNLDLLAAYGV